MYFQIRKSENHLEVSFNLFSNIFFSKLTEDTGFLVAHGLPLDNVLMDDLADVLADVLTDVLADVVADVLACVLADVLADDLADV